MICKHVTYMTGTMKMRNIVFLLCMLICMSTCMDNGEESPHRNITNDGATADVTANAMADEDVELDVRQCPLTSSNCPSSNANDIDIIQNLRNFNYVNNDKHYVVGFVKTYQELVQLIQDFEMSFTTKFAKYLRRPKNFGERSKYFKIKKSYIKKKM